MYRQLYGWFRRAIVEGALHPGQRLPSTRALATELRLSRITVLNAFEQLYAEGYLEGRVGAGTFVTRTIPDEMHRPEGQRERSAAPQGRSLRANSRPFSIYARTLASRPPEPWLANLGAFRVSLPALDQFPFEIWSRLITRHSRRLLPAEMAYGDPMGCLPLRKAIAEYL